MKAVLAQGADLTIRNFHAPKHADRLDAWFKEACKVFKLNWKEWRIDQSFYSVTMISFAISRGDEKVQLVIDRTGKVA